MKQFLLNRASPFRATPRLRLIVITVGCCITLHAANVAINQAVVPVQKPLPIPLQDHKGHLQSGQSNADGRAVTNACQVTYCCLKQACPIYYLTAGSPKADGTFGHATTVAGPVSAIGGRHHLWSGADFRQHVGRLLCPHQWRSHPTRSWSRIIKYATGGTSLFSPIGVAERQQFDERRRTD